MVIFMSMPVVVVYDIQTTKWRNQLSAVCKDFGLSRMQLSVFGGVLPAKDLKELKHILNTMMGEMLQDDDQGRLMVLPLVHSVQSDAVFVHTESSRVVLADPQEVFREKSLYDWIF